MDAQLEQHFTTLTVDQLNQLILDEEQAASAQWDVAKQRIMAMVRARDKKVATVELKKKLNSMSVTEKQLLAQSLGVQGIESAEIFGKIG